MDTSIAPKLNHLPDSFYDKNDAENVYFLCGNPNYKLLHKVEHFEFPFSFYQCQCGIEKQIPMPNEHFFEWFFNSKGFFESEETDKKEIWGYYNYFNDESSRLATSKNRYKRLRSFFEEKEKANIMKIGPATGTMLYVAKEHGHNVRGADVSNNFANYARSNYGVEIDIGRFEKIGYEKEKWDILLLFNVIENVPNQLEFLTEINRTVKNGGYFISNFVQMDNNFIAKMQGSKYFLYRPPICYGYSLTAYKKLMKKFGFEIVEVKKDIRYMHLEKISTLLRWKWLLKLAKFFRIDRINFPIYAYPSKIIVAKKIKNI